MILFQGLTSSNPFRLNIYCIQRQTTKSRFKKITSNQKIRNVVKIFEKAMMNLLIGEHADWHAVWLLTTKISTLNKQTLNVTFIILDHCPLTPSLPS